MRTTVFRCLLLLGLTAALASCSSSSAEKKPDWWSQQQQKAAEKPAEDKPEQPAEQPAEPKAEPDAAQQPAGPDQEVKQAQKPQAPAETAQAPAEQQAASAPAAAAAAATAAAQTQTPLPPPPVVREEPPPPPPEPAGIPYEKAFPEAFKQVAPIRIGILSSPQSPEAGEQIALIISNFQRERLEQALGRPLRIAFISRSTTPHKRKTHIRYRPDYLKAAIQVATAIPSEQVVEPMSETELSREEVDMFIYVGSAVQ